MISPLVRRKRLAKELRQLREAAGLTHEQLGKKTKLHRLKISRLENAQGRPNVSEVMTILDQLGVEGDRWHKLIEVAADGGEKGWWQEWGDDMGTRQQQYADLEAGATTIREYNNYALPGLLQTTSYNMARAIQTRDKGEKVPDDLDRQVSARGARQRMLRRPSGPRYEAILEEVVVRRPTASPAAMSEQLSHLIELAAEDQYTILVLPIESGLAGYWSLRAPFSLYTYEDPEDPNVVAVDVETEDLVSIEPADVERYTELYRRARKAALPPKNSVAFLKQAMAGFERKSGDEKS